MRFLTLLVSICVLMFSCKDEKETTKKFVEIPEADAHRMIDQYYDSLSAEQQKATKTMTFDRNDVAQLLSIHKGADSFRICFAAFDKVSASKYAEMHKVPYDSVYNKPTVLFAIPKQGAYETAYYMEATICPPPRSCDKY